jgi:hypothetical protein
MIKRESYFSHFIGSIVVKPLNFLYRIKFSNQMDVGHVTESVHMYHVT